MILKSLLGPVLAGVITINGISPAKTVNPPPEATMATSRYTVVSGDSLYTIAKKFGTSIASIQNANGLKSDRIYPGQILSIPGTTSATGFTPLYVGSQGAAVSTLQKNLKALGYYTYGSITGYYGTVTKQAVSKFQSAYGLTATGTVNSATNTQIWHALVKKRLVNNSFKFTGVPYKWGGTTPSGFDCSGFVYYMFNYEGLKFPRTTSEEIYTMGTKITSTAKLMPGDLVFFAVNRPGVISHVGFYVGNGKFISATTSKGIYTYPLTTGYWAKYYMGAKRVY
jgi:peptidoglycan endopeptidase LytF